MLEIKTLPFSPVMKNELKTRRRRGVDLERIFSFKVEFILLKAL